VANGIWNTPSGQDRRWKRRRVPGAFASGGEGATKYLKFVVVILAAVLAGTFIWSGVQKILHPAAVSPAGPYVSGDRPYATTDDTADSGAPTWEVEFNGALKAAMDAGIAGNVTAAEVEVDRGAAIVISARSKGWNATPEFFAASLKTLDQIVDTQPENARLRDHAFQARVELAELRTTVGAAKPAEAKSAADPVSGHALTANVGPGTVAPHAVKIPGHVVFSAPHALSAKQTLNAASLHGDYVDATLMPDEAEVFLPPATRGFGDDVRVEGVTIEGASQTLDGVQWKDVTFIGARLRYEGGAARLQNVKFVRCTFGFSSDERGTKLANAIAGGVGSIVLGAD
jgi:hypothetical protein